MRQPAGSLQLATLSHWLLIIFPLGLGRAWGLKKRGMNLLLLPGYGESRKLRPQRRPPIPGLCPWDAGVNSKEAGLSEEA